MSLRGEIGRLRGEVEQLRAAIDAGSYEGARDPADLMRQAGLDPDPWQADLLRAEWHRALLLCSRQVGKSTAAAALGLHAAMAAPETQVMIVSPAQDQSIELHRRMLSVYNRLENPPGATAESLTRTVFANGSRILCLPGTERAVRSYSADLLILDEAARILDEVYFAAEPMLAATGGRLIALSTAWGQRGWFYRAWTEGGDSWRRVKVPVYECRRITREWIAQKRAELPAMIFASEYLCEFVANIDSVFNHEDIERAFTDDVEPLFQGEEAEDDVKLLFEE